MNTNNIKKYAPQARNQFRDAVIQKLTTLGISVDKKGTLQIADAEIVGETVRYGQFDYSKSTLTRRQRRSQFPRRHHQRVVPRRNGGDHAQRIPANHRRMPFQILSGRLSL